MTEQITEQTLFKTLGRDGEAVHGTHSRPFKWSLPTQNEDGTWQAGEWMPAVKGKLVMCENGYHLTNLDNLLRWSAARCFVAEYRAVDGEEFKQAVVRDNEKVCVRQARLLSEVTNWNDRTLRLFACDCVDHMLDNLKKPFPDIDKMRAVVAVARRYANEQATQQELAAAREAAWGAGWDAAWGAARDAAWGATRDATWAAAWDAGWDATWDAARAAARAAGWDAARGAEGKWQRGRLLEYLNGQVEVVEEAVAEGGAA